MEYRYLGNSGLQVSALSFGTWITLSDQMNEEMAHCLIPLINTPGGQQF